MLAEIGRHLLAQPTRVSVRVPRALADRAVAAWEREEADSPVPPETVEQATIRDRAATLSLVGLSIEDRGAIDGDDVVVELDAWYIGNSLQAADDEGLINGPGPAT